MAPINWSLAMVIVTVLVLVLALALASVLVLVVAVVVSVGYLFACSPRPSNRAGDSQSCQCFPSFFLFIPSP